jgi:hypothetical protein
MDIYKNIPNQNLAKPLPTFSRSFMKRVLEEYELKMKNRIPIEQKRILTAENITHWMEQLEALYNKYNFPPQLIFNFDETMLHPDENKIKVISRSGKPRPFVETASKGEHISLGLTISASGQFLQPLCILPLKFEPPTSPEVHNFYAFSGQENGFITKEIWLDTLKNVIVPGINQKRAALGTPDAWALLIVDPHNSRDLAEAVEYCLAHRIIIFCMPAHSSTILQPLDLTVNKALKVALRAHFKPIDGESVPNMRNRLLYTTVFCL